ncbi:MAG: hypothetical protein WBM13_10630 [Bacteroidia bacterium]
MKKIEQTDSTTETFRKFEYVNSDGFTYIIKIDEQGFTKIRGPQGTTYHTPYYPTEFNGYRLQMLVQGMSLWQLTTPCGYFFGIGNPFNNSSWKQFRIKNLKILYWLREKFGVYAESKNFKDSVVFSEADITEYSAKRETDRHPQNYEVSKKFNSVVSFLPTSSTQTEFDFYDVKNNFICYQATLKDNKQRMDVKQYPGKGFNVAVDSLFDNGSAATKGLSDEVVLWLRSIVILSLNQGKEMLFNSTPYRTSIFNGLNGKYVLREMERTGEIALTIPTMTITGSIDDFKSVNDFLELVEKGQLPLFMEASLADPVDED